MGPSHRLGITMREEEFIETVRQEAPIETNDAARSVADATLRTLGERITDGQVEEVAPALPDAFAEPLTEASPGEAEEFGLEEFADRVSDRAGVEAEDVTVHARAVVTAASIAVDEDELENVQSQLPSEFDVVFEPGGPIQEEGFLETVQERAGLDSTDAAREATEATLGTLGERLTEGQAADLALYLPDAFEETLVQPGDETTTYSFEEFVEQVADREDVGEGTAETHARAVGSTLAETASEREIGNTKKQLPDPFGVLFDEPGG